MELRSSGWVASASIHRAILPAAGVCSGEPARLPLRVDLQVPGPGLVLLGVLIHSTAHSKYLENKGV